MTSQEAREVGLLHEWADGAERHRAAALEAAAEAVRLRERLADIARREALDEITRQQANTQTEILRERLRAAEARAIAFYSASPLENLHYSEEELVAAWHSGEVSLLHKREAIAKYVERISIRPRLNRNERANADMVTIVTRQAEANEGEQ